MIQPGIYRHYKGKMYRVIGIGRNSETLEECVVYQALYDDYGIWIRPYKMFTETIKVDGKAIPRFTFITPGVTRSPMCRP